MVLFVLVFVVEEDEWVYIVVVCMEYVDVM